MVAKTKEKSSGKGSRPHYGISGKMFVIVWNTAKSVQDVQNKLSKIAGRTVNLGAIQSRAVLYRNKHKIAMKKFSRVGGAIDQATFNDLGSRAQQLDEETRSEIDRRINEQGSNVQFDDLFVVEKPSGRKLAGAGK